MNRSSKFSIIVSTFNRPQLLRDALQSVISQTIDDFECIVVNDGEADVDLPDDERFTLIDKREGAGMSASLNTGINEARGEYLTFLDDDDAYTPRRLELGLRGVAKAPIAICWRANYDTGVAGPNRILEGWVNDVVLDRSPPMLGQTTVQRSQMIPLDESLRHAADVEWWIRSTRVLPVATVREVGFLLRRHPLRTSLDLEFRYIQRLKLHSLHPGYFGTHRRAAERFHKRTGIFAYQAGHLSVARRHLWLAAKASPDARALYHLARAPVGRR